MVKEKYKQLYLSHHIGGIRAMYIHKCCVQVKRPVFIIIDRQKEKKKNKFYKTKYE